MALMTKQQYQDSIRARKPMNVWFLGEKIEDLTTYPPLRRARQHLQRPAELRGGRQPQDPRGPRPCRGHRLLHAPLHRL